MTNQGLLVWRGLGKLMRESENPDMEEMGASPVLQVDSLPLSLLGNHDSITSPLTPGAVFALGPIQLLCSEIPRPEVGGLQLCRESCKQTQGRAGASHPFCARDDKEKVQPEQRGQWRECLVI